MHETSRFPRTRPCDISASRVATGPQICGFGGLLITASVFSSWPVAGGIRLAGFNALAVQATREGIAASHDRHARARAVESPGTAGDALRATLHIPVWHDDQQGTATCLLAGLLNALKVVGKPKDRVRIAMVGMGAANVACYRLLSANGIDPQAIVACDRKGILHKGRHDVEAEQEQFSDPGQLYSDAAKVMGDAREATRVLMREGLIAAPPDRGP